ncbi:SGNH/GDSL hydrolase family protein [Paraliomyxa miuraensis]|uniref:SGNH/GDSL hydrolase family protein n=1 Tax=Paraliomyxa miuraensis TaxID=376150 RepID=UPI002255BE06|nr:SGNH/GDSL hydrolase family protein [Paraliomyxa miuraensis]MCX4241770.1 SGNH/GDSL hydrolase family protein [Paraliomyxa miuraensis]
MTTIDWLAATVVMAASCGVMACGDPSSSDSGADGSSGGDETAGPGTTGGDPSTSEPDSSGEQGSVGVTTEDPGQTTDATTGDDTTGDPPGNCQPIPTRMVVLGDSIVACAGVGGKDSDDCSPKQLNDHVAASHGPITYENLSVGGAVTTDVSNYQIFDIEVGIPGHVLVMIYVGGNDLAQYIVQSDQAAIDGWNDTTGPEVAAAWEDILDFLGDPANFPDGVTLLMNTQYNPFDDCTAAPYFVSQTKTDLLHAHNDALTERAASREWAFIADQHPSYLGHGNHYAVNTCPYYDESAAPWMGDLIHPNAVGHAHLTEILAEVADTQIYGGCE